ncbi:hypothetical protein N8467_00600 [bacterium]|nr:hypothetical protein [bacterium]
MISKKESELLGCGYRNIFKIGQYVEWRRMSKNENKKSSVEVFQGIITDLRPVEVGGRNVWYAEVMQNGGKNDLILLSKIRKIETN